jgi:hypothetical protein
MASSKLKRTGHTSASCSRSARPDATRLTLSVAAFGKVTSTASRAMRRGGPLVIVFFTWTCVPSRTKPCLREAMPITVAMQLPRPAATRSVAEKDAPRP